MEATLDTLQADTNRQQGAAACGYRSRLSVLSVLTGRQGGMTAECRSGSDGCILMYWAAEVQAHALPDITAGCSLNHTGRT